MSYPGRFYTFDHQGKARAFVDALLAAGWRVTLDAARAMFVLADLDGAGRMAEVEGAWKNGARVFMYPHAARPPVQWDGLMPVWPGTSAHFVASAGAIEVMRAYGYPLPLHAVGWQFGELRAFRPVATDRRLKVLYGPIHPNSNGWLSELDIEINRAVYARLLKLVDAGCIELTVRYVRFLRQCGLQPDGRVKFVAGRPFADQALRDIDQADVVVGHQTFAYLAVARGVPTVMMAEWEAPRTGISEQTFARVASWEKYRDLLMFPLDLLAGDDPWSVLEAAAQPNAAVAAWRDRIIGGPFDGPGFVRALEAYL